MYFNDLASRSSPSQTSDQPSTSSSAKNSTPPVLQLAKTIGNKAMTNLVKKTGNQRSQMPVLQGKFKDIEATNYKDGEYKNNPYNDGQFTSVFADKGLPTFYGVVKDTYGADNVQANFFLRTKELGDTCDRPRSVTAVITMGKSNSDRKGESEVSAIGNLGTEERLIRDGENETDVVSYDGGHLVGYQILRGKEADQHWNVAPQDTKNNEHSYNNTIEKMLREASDGTEYVYTVEVKYDQLNFSVDQEQLVEVGALKKVDSTKPWEIQLPVRIPFKWDAKAEMTSKEEAEWEFGRPTGGTSSYDQFSQGMDEGKLNPTKAKYTARYNLSLVDSEGTAELYDSESDNFKADEVKGIRYAMHQSLPTDFKKHDRPVDWKGEDDNKVAKFGAVTKGLASKSTNLLETIKTKLARNTILAEEIEEVGDVKNPGDIPFIPSFIEKLNVRDLKKCVFIHQLDEKKAREEYEILRDVKEDYYNLFSLQKAEATRFEEKQKEIETIAGKLETWLKDTDTDQEEIVKTNKEEMETIIKTLDGQTHILTHLKNHRTGRKLYQQTVNEIYPLYQAKVRSSLEMVAKLFDDVNIEDIEELEETVEVDEMDTEIDTKKRKNEIAHKKDKRKKYGDSENLIIQEAKKMYLRKSVEDYLNKQ